MQPSEEWVQSILIVFHKNSNWSCQGLSSHWITQEPLLRRPHYIISVSVANYFELSAGRNGCVSCGCSSSSRCRTTLQLRDSLGCKSGRLGEKRLVAIRRACWLFSRLGFPEPDPPATFLSTTNVVVSRRARKKINRETLFDAYVAYTPRRRSIVSPPGDK